MTPRLVSPRGITYESLRKMRGRFLCSFVTSAATVEINHSVQNNSGGIVARLIIFTAISGVAAIKTPKIHDLTDDRRQAEK